MEKRGGQGSFGYHIQHPPRDKFDPNWKPRRGGKSDDSGFPDFPSRALDLSDEEVEVVIEEAAASGPLLLVPRVPRLLSLLCWTFFWLIPSCVG